MTIVVAEMEEEKNDMNRQARKTPQTTTGKKTWRWSTPQELTTTDSSSNNNNNTSLAAQKEVFLNMQLRKSNRALTGTKSRNTTFEFVVLAVFLTVIFSTAAQDCYENGTCTSDTSFVSLTFGQVVAIGSYTFLAIVISSVFKESKFIELLYWMFIYLPLTFTMLALVMDDAVHNDLRGELTSGAIVGILFLIAECLALFIFVSIYFLYPRLVNSTWFRQHNRAALMFWNVVVVADWTFSYTKRKSRLLLGRNHICKYQGDFAQQPQQQPPQQQDSSGGGGENNKNGGLLLPHGTGQWFDDSAEGEILHGHWHYGNPVAPFISRQFKTGDAFIAVRLAYMLASDDDGFDGSSSAASSKFFPTNQNAPKCGIVSVECSVSGAFYNELPCTREYVPGAVLQLREPQKQQQDDDDDDDGPCPSGGGATTTSISMQEILSHLIHFRPQEETDTILQIKANDLRGIQIDGHLKNDKTFSKEVDEIVVKVQRHYREPSPRASGHGKHSSNGTTRCRRLGGGVGLKFMPMATRSSSDVIAIHHDHDANDDDDVVDHPHSRVVPVKVSSPSRSVMVREASTVGSATTTSCYSPLEDDQQTHNTPLTQDVTCDYRSLDEVDSVSCTPPPPRMLKSEREVVELEDGQSTNNKQPVLTKLSLQVSGWAPTKKKDALIFIPGFNCPLSKAMSSFGQLVAMTRLDSRVYPILYEWPCGQVLTYHAASQAAANEQNRKNFCLLLQGLQSAGIHNVHIMSHSMGAQTLLGSFCDDANGSRSNVSRCFHLASDCDEAKEIQDEEKGTNNDNNNEKLLVCKTVTMLNPDFPLESFVNHSFQSVRRICRNVTVVGDRNDQALFWSQFINGIAVYCGYTQPETLQPNQANKDRLGHQLVVGKAINHLYLPAHLAKASKYHDYQIFPESAPLVLLPYKPKHKNGHYKKDEESLDKLWLDLDVIDTTGLDTNVATIRHSAYNLNPSLLNDLEELITTGNRAMKRPSLLYRDGNIFSYCHAPSYVAM
jgi:Alpha/beta hydrolase of unknown function (DUF900)